MDPETFSICPIASLIAAAEHARIPFYLTDGRLIIRPVRNADAETELLRSTLAHRRSEVGTFMRAHPRHRLRTEQEERAEADRISIAVFGLPWEVVTQLVISDLALWTRRAFDGQLSYEPSLPPQWDDDLVHRDAHDAPPKPRKPRRTRAYEADRVVFG